MRTIVKLGGSVITDKSSLKKPNTDVIRRLCRELSIMDEGIIVHGGGSFGHIKAVQYGFKNGCETRKYFSEIHRDMILLNELVVSSLLDAEINAVSVPPHTFYPFGNLSAFEYYLDNDFIPVTYGDVYWKNGKGWIISGDTLVFMLSEAFRPEMVVFVSNVDGIYSDIEKKTILRRISADDVTRIKISEVGDATGGLKRKLEIMLKISSLGIRTLFINGLIENNLRNALSGKEFVGTEVTP